MLSEKEAKEDEEEEATETFGHSLVATKQQLSLSQHYVDMDYDSCEYPVAHVPLSETLHFVVEHPCSGTLLMTSRGKYIAGTVMLKSSDIRPTERYFYHYLLQVPAAESVPVARGRQTEQTDAVALGL